MTMMNDDDQQIKQMQHNHDATDIHKDASSSSHTVTPIIYPTTSSCISHESLLVQDVKIRRLTLHRSKPLIWRWDIWLYSCIYICMLTLSMPAIVYEYNRAPDVMHDSITSNGTMADTHVTTGQYDQPILPPSQLKSLFDDEHDETEDTAMQHTHEDIPSVSTVAESSDMNVSMGNTTAESSNNSNLTDLIDPLTGLRRLTADELASMPSQLSFAAMFFIPFVIASHLALLLSTYWNINIQTHIRYNNVPLTNIDDATHIRVIPIANNGLPAITPLLHDSTHRCFFEYHKTKYFWHSSEQQLKRLDNEQPPKRMANNTHGAHNYFAAAILPLDGRLCEYAASEGFVTVDAQMSAASEYGENYFDIPLPPFMDLFYEHAMAPFFVFQVFCVLLWCLDEYWYYSMLTLFMLVAFEATLVKRRQKNLDDLRAMRQRPYVAYVFRCNKWQQMTTDHIYPRDLISLTASSKQLVCPADVLLLTGNTVVNEAMLTGESVPQIKEAIEPVIDMNERLSINKLHKRSVVFGGTKVMLCNSHSSDRTADASESNGDTNARIAANLMTHIPSPPDNGCIGYVLRTGFHTSQGDLVRTILFNTEHVNVNNREAIMFIGFLLVFAITASGYVLYHGLQDANRSRYKLMLNCIMIITSVVPPELPMELSLAVNTSLLHLAKSLIYCTEPFRIPLAGGIDVCAFDKTGTLTSDNFVVKGIAGLNSETVVLTEPPTIIPETQSAPTTTSLAASVSQQSAASTATNTSGIANTSVAPASSTGGVNVPVAVIKQREYTEADRAFGLTQAADVDDIIKFVVSGCHSLVSVDGKLVGDPVETAGITSIGYSVDSNSVSTGTLTNGQPAKLHIVNRYAFSSVVKRMSCVIALDHDRNSDLMVVCKGAAEILRDRLVDRPANYDDMVKHYSRQGCRVLALSYKRLVGLKDNQAGRSEVKQMKRDLIENQLCFAGLLVLEVPMKSDSAGAVQQLIESNHHVIMITGDNTLTACSVASELSIADKALLVLHVSHNSDSRTSAELFWQSVDEQVRMPFDSTLSKQSLAPIVRQYDLCISGDALEHLVQTHTSTAQLTSLFRCAVVYARTSPDQKELIVRSFKQHGMYTLMCGDGTNDVGALKQAHVGVALIASAETPAEGATHANNHVNGQSVAQSPAQNKLQAQVEELRQKSVSIQQNKQLSFTQKMAQQAAIIAQHKQIVQQMQQANAPPRAPPKPLNEMTPAEVQAFQRQQISDLLGSLDDGSAAMVRLGDASIASPFTSKKPFITSCIDIIRQGRCTLVTTLQMFNILGINCLMSAYSMSVLYLDGVKYGDYQMTISGMSVAIFFMCLSNTKPLNRLAPERPDTKLFSLQMLISVAGQWCIHMCFLLSIIWQAELYVPRSHEHRIVEKKFTPNILNTVVFLLSNSTTVTTFVCNYRGAPFMQGLSANSGLKRALTAVFGLCLLLVSDMMPDLNYMLELVPMPNDDFRYNVIAAMLGDLAVTYLFVRGVRSVFQAKPVEMLLTHRFRTPEHQQRIATEQMAEQVATQPSFATIWAQAREQAKQAQQDRLAAQARKEQ